MGRVITKPIRARTAVLAVVGAIALASGAVILWVVYPASPAPTGGSSLSAVTYCEEPASDFIKKTCAACSGKGEEGLYAEGQVSIFPVDEASTKEVYAFFEEHSLDAMRTPFLDDPTTIVLEFHDATIRPLEADAVNRLLSEIRNHAAVSSLEISTFWHKWPLSRWGSVDEVQRIDRYGYFIVTLHDARQYEELLSDFSSLTPFVGPEEEIGYKALEENQYAFVLDLHEQVAVAEAILAEIQDGPYEIKYPFGRHPVLTIHDSVRDSTDTTYESRIFIDFPALYSVDEIVAILRAHPEIDLEKMKVRVNTFRETIIRVPSGQEQCWANQLEGHELIKRSGVNSFVFPDVGI